MKTVKAAVTVREGRKIVASGISPITSIEELMLRAMTADKVMLNFALLREGESFTFKLDGRSLTVNPLVNHISNY